MMTAGLVKLIGLVPAVVSGLRSIGAAKVAAEAAGAAAGGAAEAAGAAGAASGAAGSAAAGASAGWFARLMPWLLKGGVAASLMTYSKGLNEGEAADLARRRASEGSQWGGDPIGEKLKAAAESNPIARSVQPGQSDTAKLFADLEGKYSLPNGLLDSVWSAESARGKSMLSPAGAEGHFQFMPATARQYGVNNPYDLRESATGAARMYADLLRQNGGDLSRALAGYNWGQGNLSRKGLENAPAETRGYIRKVLAGMPLGSGAAPTAQLQAQSGDAPMASIYKAREQSGESGSAASRLAGGESAQGQQREPQFVRVEIDMRGAPTGTTARVKSSRGVMPSLNIGVAQVGMVTV